MDKLELWLLQKFEPDCGVIVDSADSESPNKKGAIHVLHVDDDPSVLEISKLLLMDMGNFEIEYACCVDDAFDYIYQQCNLRRYTADPT
jgi:hypothetical protein